MSRPLSQQYRLSTIGRRSFLVADSFLSLEFLACSCAVITIYCISTFRQRQKHSRSVSHFLASSFNTAISYSTTLLWTSKWPRKRYWSIDWLTDRQFPITPHFATAAIPHSITLYWRSERLLSGEKTPSAKPDITAPRSSAFATLSSAIFPLVPGILTGGA